MLFCGINDSKLSFMKKIVMSFWADSILTEDDIFNQFKTRENSLFIPQFPNIFRIGRLNFNSNQRDYIV